MPIGDIRDIFLRVTAHYENPDRAFNQIQRQLKSLRGEAVAASGGLSAFNKEWRKVGSEKGEVHMDLSELEEFQSILQKSEETLRKISRRKFSLDPSIRHAAATQAEVIRDREQVVESHLRSLRAMYDDDLAAFALNERDKAIEARTSGAAQTDAADRVAARMDEIRSRNKARGTIIRDLMGAPREFANAGKAAEKAALQAATWGDRLDQLANKVKAFVPALRGLSVVVGVALVSAIGAMIGSLTMAVAGMAGLATSLTAVVIPAFALFAAVMSRIGEVMNVVDARQRAAEARAKALADQERIRADNADRLRNAQNRVRDATEGVSRAEEDLAEAHDDLGRAQQAAFEEMADAAARARQALLDLRDARLSVDEASLSLREAQLRLKQFRQEAGLTGASFDDMFQTFQNVAYDPKALRKALTEAKKKGDLDEEQALELERLLLNVEQAKLDEKQATEDLKSAELDLTRARREDQRYQRLGINASDTYRNAVERVEDAEVNLVDARQRVVEAERDLTDVRKQNRDALKGNLDQLQEAKRKFDELSTSEQHLVTAIEKARKGFVDFIRKGTDPILDSLAKVVDKFRTAPKTIGDFWESLGKTVGTNITLGALTFETKEWTDAFKELKGPVLDIIGLLTGPIAMEMLAIFRDLAVAFMPSLVDLMHDFSDTLSGLQGKTAGIDPSTVDLMVDSFKTFVDLLKSGGELLFSFGKIAAPFGNDFLKWIADGMKGLADFFNSAEGQKQMSRFFEDTLPFAKELLKFVGKLGLLFFEVFEFFAPALADLFAGLNTVLDVLIWGMRQLNRLPTWLKRIVGFLIPLIGIMRGGLFAAPTLSGHLGKLMGNVGMLTARLMALGAIVRGSFGDAFDWASDRITAFLDSIDLGAAVDRGREIIGSILDGIRSLLGAGDRSGRQTGSFASIGSGIVTDIAAGITSRVTDAWNAGRRIVNNVRAGLAARAEETRAHGARIIGRFVAGAVERAEQALRLGRRFISWIWQGISETWWRVTQIGRDIVHGFRDGVQEVSQDLVDAVSEVIGRVISVVQTLLDIRSPSGVFATLGSQTIAGFIVGIQAGRGGLIATMERLFGTDVWRTAATALLGSGGKLTNLLPGMFGKAGRAVEKFLTGTGDFIWTESVTGRVLPHFGTRRLGKLDAPSPSAAKTAATKGLALARAAGGRLKTTIRERLLSEFGGLAAGGIATGPALRVFGEAGKEAVLPLSQSVMAGLAQAIVMEMPQLGAGGRGGYGINIGQINLPPAPAAQVPDARHQAVQLAAELRRRGGL